jgi:branched-chain amino acid transport system permease protein
VQQVGVNILVLGATYALIALGYVTIYRVSRVLNLAHGELMMLGAYLLLSVAEVLPLSAPAAVLFAAMLGIAVGLAVYAVLMRGMTGQAVFASILATIAFGIFLRGVAVLVWSPQHRYPGKLLGVADPAIRLGGHAVISLVGALIVGTTLLCYAAMFGFLRFGRWGIRMRACGQNPLLAAQSGIDLHVIYAVAWAIATFTAGLAGILVALENGVDTTMATIGLKAFPGALVGGLDSFAGALLGSVIVSGCEVVAIQFIDPLLSDVVPFVILLAMLAIRPWGLFGTREELDRV